MAYRLGVDIGGTFTDFALVDDGAGEIAIHKVLTTPRDPSEAVLEGLDELLKRKGVGWASVDAIVHGTTLVTNAVIERKGAITGMLVTKGFRDVLDIALERRYDLFDLRLKLAPAVVPRRLRREIDERLKYTGEVTQPLDPDAAVAAARELVEQHGVKALAICFLHSYANPAHEQAARDAVVRAFPELYVSTSADVLPFMREYERWCTATVNAYSQPMTDRYLGRLERSLAERGFRGAFLVMTSSGGTLTAGLARRYPVRLIESGPAAGALMSSYVGQLAGAQNLLSFDMGGTTAKGALVRNGRPLKKFEMEVARVHNFKQGSGLPLRIPVIDMIEIGAGGGSIAEVDERGLFQVGPQSAGAEPGPACYGRGGARPTLTDANLLLGCLDAGFFLGGQMRLDVAAAERALIDGVARPLALAPDRAAWGVHETINEDVARAFRIHASEVGFDYRKCSMVAFGGSGPVHAMRIARKLRIPEVIFPAGAGVMSAIGMLVTPLSFETLRTQRLGLDALDAAGYRAAIEPLIAQARRFLVEAGEPEAGVRVQCRLDMRYRGQGYEIEVAVPEELDAAAVLTNLPEMFRAAYAEVFSLSHLDAPIEIVNWKVEASGPRPKLADDFRVAGGQAGRSAEKGRRPLYLPEQGGMVDCPVYDRYALKPGSRLTGPAIVEENESTCVIGPGDEVVVDRRYNLIARLAYS
jgi:N-methylhydantoinase A